MNVPDPTAVPHRLFSLHAGLMALLLFAFSLALNTRHNDFPYSYHPDEGGKTGQIIGGIRNYHHPLLLLSATDIVSRLALVPRQPQPIVETGRWVSAVFAAGSVATLAVLAWLLYGPLVGWGAGVAVALQVDLFESAHYMKEDPALLFGICLSLLAAALWRRAPGRRTLRFLAIACALAVSGKYLGIIVLIFILPMVVWHRAADAELPRKSRLLLFAAAFGLTFLICNLPVFATHLSSPFRSIGNEVQDVASGHGRSTRSIPHGAYLETLHENAPGILLVLAGVYAVYLLATPRRRSAAEWTLFLLPTGYLAAISCSAKTADRYLLPVNVLLPLLAILGTAEICRTLDSEKLPARRMISYFMLVGLMAWVALAELPPLRETYDGYRRDDPADVAAWVKANLPLDAVIVEDHRVNLSPTKSEKQKGPVDSSKTEDTEEKGDEDGIDFAPSKDARVPQKVYSPNFASQLGTLDQLRKSGVTHVVICKQTYGRFFKDGSKSPAEGGKSSSKQGNFYAEVMAGGRALKEWPPGKISYLQPGIKLFSIVPAKE